MIPNHGAHFIPARRVSIAGSPRCLLARLVGWLSLWLVGLACLHLNEACLAAAPKRNHARDEELSSPWMWLGQAEKNRKTPAEITAYYREHQDALREYPQDDRLFLEKGGFPAQAAFIAAKAAYQAHDPEAAQLCDWADHIASAQIKSRTPGVAMPTLQVHHSLLEATVASGDYELALHLIDAAKLRYQSYMARPKDPRMVEGERLMPTIDSMHIRTIARSLGDYATVESELRNSMAETAEWSKKSVKNLQSVAGNAKAAQFMMPMLKLLENQTLPELAEALAKQGKTAEAKETLARWKKGKPGEKGGLTDIVLGAAGGMVGGARAAKDGVSFAETWLAIGDAKRALEEIDLAEKGEQLLAKALDANPGRIPNSTAQQKLLRIQLYQTKARCLWSLGRADEVPAVLAAALETLKDSPSSLSDQISLRQMQAWCLLALNRTEEAGTEAAKLAEDQLTMVDNLLHFASEQQRMLALQQMDPFSLLVATGQTAALVPAILRLKGVVLDSVLEEKRMTLQSGEGAARSAFLQLQSKRKDWNQAVIEGSSTVETLRQEVAALEVKIAAMSSNQPHAHEALKVTLGQVQDALAPTDALVEFIRYRYLVKPGAWGFRYGAAVIRSGEPARWVELGEAQAVEAAVGRFIKHMAAVADARDPAALESLEPLLPAQLRQLFDLTLAPLLPHIGSAKRLIISPDGSLGQLSFSALLAADGRLAGEQWEIAYVSTGRDLLRDAQAPPAAPTMLIVANPDLLAANKSAGPSHDARAVFVPYDRNALPRLGPLPGTKKEMDSLEGLVTSQGISVRSWTDADARESRLAGLSPGPTYLHFATHGLVLAPTATIQHLSRGEGLEVRSSSPPVADNPLQRSILALAGAGTTLAKWRNGELPPPEDDGVLSALEIATLDLSETWLAVLSACSTAAGEPLAGEGVMGMRRGFFLAGVKNIMMTFWNIDDDEAAAFMMDFYKDVGETHDPASSLGHVQQGHMAKWRKEKGLQAAVFLACPFALSVSGKQSLSSFRSRGPVPVLTRAEASGDRASKIPPPAARELALELNHSVYTEGDEMSVTITAPDAGYLYVMAIEADGNCVPLYPSSLVASDAHVAAGKILHLPTDLPPNADGRVEKWPVRFPSGFPEDSEVTESIVAFLSPTPRDFPQHLGRLEDSAFRSRGPHPQLFKLDSGTITFDGLPQAAVHYTIRRKP